MICSHAQKFLNEPTFIHQRAMRRTAGSCRYVFNKVNQTCPCWVRVAQEKRQIKAKFLCIVYGYSKNAVVVCAIHFLERGQRFLEYEEECSVLVPKTVAKLAFEWEETTKASTHEVSHA